MMQPRQRYRDEAEAAARALFPGYFKLPRPFAAIFVRGGDKVVERPLYSVESYFNALEPYAISLNITHVYFNSDDARVLSDAVRLYGADSRYILHIPHPDFTLNLPAFFSSRNYPVLGKATHSSLHDNSNQISLTLADIYLQAQADVRICYLSSNMCRIIDQLALGFGKAALRIDVSGEYRIQ